MTAKPTQTPASGGPSAHDARAEELARGRAAYAARAWADAFSAFTHADAIDKLAGDDLAQLAWSCALCGKDDDFLATLARLHQLHLDAGEPLRAARWAFWSGFRLFALGEAGRAGAWLTRAQRLCDAEPHCAERGYLLLPSVHRHLAARDYEAACATAATAARIGQTCCEPDLLALARSLHGRAAIRAGRIAEGLASLDEAMLAGTTGELSPLVTGLTYCSVIAACQQVYALDRAREWTAALARFCEPQAQLVPFTGACRVHRAEILQLEGAWPEAIEEALRATLLASPVERSAAAAAAYQRGEIHRMRGELDAAEAAYREASSLGGDPQPGLALLRMAQGDTAAALGALRRLLEADAEPLQRVRYLPAGIEALLAAGELDAAERACAELEAISSSLQIEVLAAIAGHARAALCLARGEAHLALAPLRAAFSLWQRVGAPYLAARIRVALAAGYRALGDADGAALELAAAREVFVRLGAATDLVALDAPTAKQIASARHGLSARELQVLRLIARGKTNAAIARELHLSEKTIDRHASNIFAKLQVPSRAAATAYAYEHALL